LQIGWLFPICWVVGVLLPFCSKNRHDRRAAIASGIMIAISVVIVVLAVAIPLGILASAARDDALATSLYNNYNAGGGSFYNYSPSPSSLNAYGNSG
jgi:Mg2+/citrate symporter